jgi:hypothetical protein
LLAERLPLAPAHSSFSLIEAQLQTAQQEPVLSLLHVQASLFDCLMDSHPGRGAPDRLQLSDDVSRHEDGLELVEEEGELLDGGEVEQR